MGYMSDTTELAELALEEGATRAAVIDIDGIRLYREIRSLCERNSCGQYGRNWMCPPHVGTIEETAARLRSFQKGLLVQSVSELEDSFDVEGMGRSQKEHQDLMRRLAESVRRRVDGEIAIMGAGPCDVCKECTILKGKPCRHPDRAMSSMEAFGMNVKEVVESCGFPYIGGKNTVSYVGMILYRTVNS